MKTDIVIGLQHGDEGKGKVINSLLKQRKINVYENSSQTMRKSKKSPETYDYCVRYNGGPNAGHTIYYNNKKVVLHQIPIGIVYGIPSIIGPACVLDISKLKLEKEELINVGIECKTIEKNLFISFNTHIIEPAHIEEDVKTDKVGSTGTGIRPTYRDKFNRRGRRVGDNDTKRICGFLVIDPYTLLYPEADPTSNQSKELSILCEGAQGFELDIDWGDYPFVTSSNCLAGFCCTAGIPPQSVNKVYGIAKIYETYVGKKQFQPPDDVFVRLQKLGNEFGATTGRPRQCNWLDLSRLIRAIKINGVTDLIINKCDIIKELDYFYIYEGVELKAFHTFKQMRSYLEERIFKIKSISSIVFSGSKDSV